MKIFYHDDMDGKCAAAIALHDANKRLVPCECIPMQYNRQYDFNRIDVGEQVVIVDFSFSREDFDKILARTANIVWIDHHKSSIEKYADIADKILGLRSTEKAGCVLTWEFYHGSGNIPYIVERIGDYDTWQFKFRETRVLHLGLQTVETNPENRNWEEWLDDCESDWGVEVYSLIDDGAAVKKFLDIKHEEKIQSTGFYAKFEGLRAVCINERTNSDMFDSVDPDTYDVMIPFVFDGRKYSFSVYSKRPEVDCAKLAEKYGGGGHKGAAGFSHPTIPFEYIQSVRFYKKEGK